MADAGQTLGKAALDTGVPTETLRTIADVTRLAIANNMSARARLVEVVFREEEKAYDIFVGTTMAEDRLCAAQLEVALATVFGLLAEQLTVNPVARVEVDLNLGVYERLLAQKLGPMPPIQ